jgi:hypothetical protein
VEQWHGPRNGKSAYRGAETGRISGPNQPFIRKSEAIPANIAIVFALLTHFSAYGNPAIQNREQF